MDLNKYDKVIIDLDSCLYGLETILAESVYKTASNYGKEFGKLCLDFWNNGKQNNIYGLFRSAMDADDSGVKRILSVTNLVLEYENEITAQLTSKISVDDICILVSRCNPGKWIISSCLNKSIVTKLFATSWVNGVFDLAICNKENLLKTINKHGSNVKEPTLNLCCGSSRKSYRFAKNNGFEFLYVTRYSRDKDFTLYIEKKAINKISSFRILYLISKFPELNIPIADLICIYLLNVKEFPQEIDQILLMLLVSVTTVPHFMQVAMLIDARYGHDHILNKLCLQIKRNFGPWDQDKTTHRLMPHFLDGKHFHVSLLCPFNGLGPGSHSDVVINHLKLLLSIEYIECVTLVFTCESSVRHWICSDEMLKLHEKREFEKIVQSTCVLGLKKDNLLKLKIVYAPLPDRLSDVLGDIVFRMEGVSPKLSHCLYARYIYAMKPIISIAFSSHVKYSPFTDLILSRNRDNLKHQEFPYLIPLSKPLLYDASSKHQPNKYDSIITVYGGDRLKDGLKRIENAAWEKLTQIFHDNPNLSWKLVGANKPEEVVGSFPELFFKTFERRISVYPKSDLTEMYKDVYVFLALPRVFGGGGGASLAISMGIPVITTRDPLSDISNNNNDEIQSSNFLDALDLLSAMLRDRDVLSNYLIRQQQYLKDRMDVSKTSERIVDAMSEAIARFQRRAI